MIYSDGSTYEGNFLNDEFHGKGKYISKDLIYDGFWKKGYSHGEGTEIWSDGNKYKGQFKMGKKHGFGVYTWQNGTTYRGMWENDNMKDQENLKIIPETFG